MGTQQGDGCANGNKRRGVLAWLLGGVCLRRVAGRRGAVAREYCKQGCRGGIIGMSEAAFKQKIWKAWVFSLWRRNRGGGGIQSLESTALP